jgi:hypothetical protein
VVNTGTQPVQYEVVLAPVTKQDQLQPTADFISITPKAFSLDPGANQVISAYLNIPFGAEPGDYLAYIEAHPTLQNQSGTNIGVAAAAKLYFTVSPASTFKSITNSAAGFFQRNAPVSYIVPGVIVLGIIIFIISRRVKLEVKMTHR